MAEPYSRIYCVADSPQGDSLRMRFRLAVFVDKLSENLHVHHKFAGEIEQECGVRVPWLGTCRDWKKFYEQAEIRDVLDSVTHIYTVLSELDKQRRGYVDADAVSWRNFVSRVLAEEHLQYAVGARCEVRFSVDESYGAVRRAALAGLAAEKWGASRAEFDRAYAALDRDSKDTNEAVRAIAASVESCAKVFIGNGTARIGPSEVQKYLRPRVEQSYAGDRVAIDSALQMLKALEDWINASHQYRHGQDGDEAVHAPLDLAVQFLTTGAGFVRWLIDIDERLCAYA